MTEDFRPRLRILCEVFAYCIRTAAAIGVRERHWKRKETGMRRFIGAVMLAAAFVAVSNGPVRAESADEIKKQIHAKVSKLKTISYKMKSVSETTDPNLSTKSTTEGTLEYMRKGDKILSRMEMTSKSIMVMGGNETKTDSKMIIVDDGEFIYNYSEAADSKHVIKQKRDQSNSEAVFNPEKGFKDTEKMYAYKALPDETVDGKPCWTLEMTPTDPSLAYIGKSVTCYDKATGMVLKSTTYDPKGKVTTSMTITDLKVDADIPAERFKFTPPPGVEVHDASKGG